MSFHAVARFLRTLLSSPRRLVVLLFGLLAVAGGSSLAYALAGSSHEPSNVLSYRTTMPDASGRTTPQGPATAVAVTHRVTTADTAGAHQWQVTLDACAAPAVRDRGEKTQVDWTISGGALRVPLQVTTGCATTQTVPALGDYTVRAALHGDAKVAVSSTVTVADPALAMITDGVNDYLSVVEALKSYTDLAKAAPFGLRTGFDTGYQKLYQWIADAKTKITALASKPGETVAQLSKDLDDIDGDKDPASDVHIPSLPELKVDLGADITTADNGKTYDAKARVKITLAQNAPLAYLADSIKIGGQTVDDGLALNLAQTVHIDPLGAKKITLPVSTTPAGTVGVSIAGNFDGANNPLKFHLGILDVSATGKISGNVGVALTLTDPGTSAKDGVIDTAELKDLTKVVSLSCTSTGASADITVNGSLAGLGAKVGHIGMTDDNVCDGVSAPDVQLGDLDQFRNITLGDLVNGIAQVTQAISSAQASGNLDMPLLKQPLASIVSVNEKLVKFFVDNGFTDKDNPMAKITVDTSADAAIQSLQQLVPKLADALGLKTPDALNMRYEDGRILFSVKVSSDPNAKPKDATLDFGDKFKNNGITALTGKAGASVDAKYDLDFGFGFDLRPGLALQDRFFLSNGANKYALALDATVKADIDLTGTASVVGVKLSDGKTDPVTLLARKDSAKPMLTVAFVPPNSSVNRITLGEIASSILDKKLPVAATINATVPAITLTATAVVAGVDVGSGTLTFGWPDLNQTTGANGFTVKGDASFNKTLLPFAFDTSNPQALIGQILSVARTTITQMRAAIAAGDATTQQPLPLVGKSVADLEPVLSKIQTALDGLLTSNNTLDLKALKDKLVDALSQALGVKKSLAAPDLSKLVKVDYKPATDSAPAAVVLNFKLGACSDDRVDETKRPGCVFTGAPLNVPFNLNLGASKVGGVLGVGSAGSVDVSYDARANLTMGVELPKVTAGANLLDLPTVSGSPKLFVQDDTSFEVGLGVKVAGTLHAGLGPIQVDLGKADDEKTKAQAALAVRFALKTPKPTGARVDVLNGSALSAFLKNMLPATPLTVHESDTALTATCRNVTGTVDACASLPVYANNVSLGTITFAAPDLFTPGKWTVDTKEVEAKLTSQAIQFALLVNGVHTLAQQLQDSLHRLPAGTKIPLLGADVSAGADLVGAFDKNVIGPVQKVADLASSVALAKDFAAKATDLLNKIPILANSGGASVVITCRTNGVVGDCSDTNTIGDLQSFEVHAPLAFTIAKDDLAPFDIGFPGLHLQSTEGSVGGSITLKLNLAFGIDRETGFYIPTKGTEPELALDVTGHLPVKMQGQLAFLPIDITDNTPKTDTSEGTDVSVGLGVDLKTDRADGRLPLQNLGDAKFAPSFHALANLNMKIATVSDADSSLPKLSADVVIAAGINWNGSGAPTTSASIDFNNVSMDAGSLVAKFIKPVASTLHKFTAPLEKPIDEIRKPIPGLSDALVRIGKKPLSWYGAFKAIDDVVTPKGQASGLQMIDRVISLVDLVREIDKDGTPAGQISIGSFAVKSDVASNPVPLDQAGSLLGQHSEIDSVLSKLQISSADDLQQADQKAGLTFPAFQHPAELFKLLLGQDVPLVYFDAGRLSIKRDFQFAFPIGPAKLYIGGYAELSGHFAMGFDTYGIRKAYELLSDGDDTNNGFWNVAAGVLQGFYLDDNDQNGNDVPEISLAAELTAGASIGIPGIEAGAEGGIHGQIDFNLHTEPSQQGKVRYTDIAKQWAVNKNPVCFFDATAQIDAFIRVYVKTFFGSAQYPIYSGTVWKSGNLTDFCRTKQDDDKPHLLADLSDDGTLTLKTSAVADGFFLTAVDDQGTYQISANGIDETYQGVKKVVADMQGGDDELSIAKAVGVTANVPVLICGGAGNDRITTDMGPARIYGDGNGECPTSKNVPGAAAGNDMITASSVADTIDGGPGNDAIDGGDGADFVSGGEGDDSLRGGLGNDTVDGGAGDDTLDYSDHADAVTINLPGTSGSAGESDTNTNVENVVGGSGKDAIKVTSGGSATIDGGTGNDTVDTGTGTALVTGGDGDDTFVGGAGSAMIVAGAGDDTMVDGPGSQTFFGQEGKDTVDYSKATKPVNVTIDGEGDDGPDSDNPDNIMDADVVIGGSGNDHLVGSGADEELRGGPGKDRIEGGAGNDVLLGGDDEDVINGNAGNDTIDGGAGNDTLRGDAGADKLNGGADFDTADYSTRTEALTITKDNVANDGSAVDGSWKDDVERDVEKVVGGSGDDVMTGWSGDETFVGGPGNDTLYGAPGSAADKLTSTGADVFDGGTGNDKMFDRDFNSRFDTDDTTNDTFLGGDGDDWANGNGGNDTYTMGAGTDEVVAGPGNDTIDTGSGDDQVRAGAGNDVIRGGDGDDSLWGDDGDDVIDQQGSTKGLGAIRGGKGNDTMTNGSNGGTIYAGTGGGSDEADNGPNTIIGGVGPKNFYIGGNGPDTMKLANMAAVGFDIVNGEGGDDVITETGDAENQLSGDDGNDTITGGNGKENLFGGAGNDTIVGNGGNDQVIGDAGDDKLFGGPGNDLVRGGADNDVLDGGTGADRFEGEGGVDTVTYATRTEPVTVVEDGNFNDGGVSDTSVAAGDNNRDYVDPTNEIIVGGSGNDTIEIGASTRTAPATLDGGPGNDTLKTRSALPTTFVGGPGDDTLIGGSGADTFVQGTAADGADDMVGNDGADVVDYSNRPKGSAFVTLDNVANDGASGERDNVHSDVENALGATGGTAPTPSVSVAPVRVTEGKAGVKTPATVTVTLSTPAGSDVTVPWSVVGGTATAGKDFTAASGKVVVPAGATRGSFTVTVLGDALDEGDETATVKLGAPTGATVKTGSATLTIVDDDAAPKVSVNSVTTSEGAAGKRTSMTFTVKLSAVSGKNVTVHVGTSNGTAKAGSDYVAKSATVTIAAGKTSATFVVTVLGDKAHEKNETVNVTLSKPVNATLGTAKGVGTIRNDDK